MSVESFNYILLKIEGHLEKRWCNLHNSPMYPEERLVIALRSLATGGSYSTLAYTFMRETSTVSGVIIEFLDVMWSVLQPVHMPVPAVRDFKRIAEEFLEKWKIPNCIGALDGKHIRIKKTANSGSLYYNYKKYFSSVLQAVVDANTRFITIDICKYGSLSNGGIFNASLTKMALTEKILTIPTPSNLPSSHVKCPHFFIGDGAYTLCDYLMTPFRRFNLTPAAKVYNKRLSRARCIVENAFGRISQKWRILYTTIQQAPEQVEKIVKAICILHKTLLDQDMYVYEDDDCDDDDDVGFVVDVDVGLTRWNKQPKKRLQTGSLRWLELFFKGGLEGFRMVQ
ncbi:hypothetical protein TKK_0010286 [Trichogramma kaykai]